MARKRSLEAEPPPPSLSRIPGTATPGCIRPNGSPACGLEHCIERPSELLQECSAAGKLRQLDQAIRKLPLKEGVSIAVQTAAWSLLMAHWEARGARGLGRRRLRKAGLSKQGRPQEMVGDDVGMVAALIFQELTGSDPRRKIVSDAWKDNPPAPHGKPYGDWHHFLETVFLVFGINAKADGVNQRLQADLKADLKARQAKLSE